MQGAKGVGEAAEGVAETKQLARGGLGADLHNFSLLPESVETLQGTLGPWDWGISDLIAIFSTKKHLSSKFRRFVNL